MLISKFKYVNSISEYWDIDSYYYVNEYGKLMLKEEYCKDLKIPKSLWPFVLSSLSSHHSLISNYRYDFGPKLLEFLGVNTKLGVPSFKHAYEKDLKSRRFILEDLCYQINYKINMCDHDINKTEEAILKEYSYLEKEQDEWYERCLYEEGREQYLKEYAEMNITID